VLHEPVRWLVFMSVGKGPASNAGILSGICVHLTLYSRCDYKNGLPVTHRTLGIAQTSSCTQAPVLAAEWCHLAARLCNSTYTYTSASVLELCINQYMTTATSDNPTKPKGYMQGCPLRASPQVLPT